jgi:hypothetical protein
VVDTFVFRKKKVKILTFKRREYFFRVKYFEAGADVAFFGYLAQLLPAFF